MSIQLDPWSLFLLRGSLGRTSWHKEQPKLAVMFKVGRYNYPTLIAHLFVKEILGQASRLSYASLTRLSSHIVCESLACKTTPLSLHETMVTVTVQSQINTEILIYEYWKYVATSPDNVSTLLCSLRRNPCGRIPKLPWRALATSEWGQEELVSGTSIHHSAVEPSEMNQTYSG